MIIKRVVAGFLLPCIVICFHGCYSKKMVLSNALEEDPEHYIFAVEKLDGEVVEFEHGAVFICDRITGYSTEGEVRQIPLAEVTQLYIREFDYPKTGAACLGTLALTVALIYVEFWIIFSLIYIE